MRILPASGLPSPNAFHFDDVLELNVMSTSLLNPQCSRSGGFASAMNTDEIPPGERCVRDKMRNISQTSNTAEVRAFCRSASLSRE